MSTSPAVTLQTKRVDYMIVLDDNGILVALLNLLRSQLDTPSAADSIHRVIDKSLPSLPPIGIVVETNTPEGGELQGRRQLCIWPPAHVVRLRALRDDHTTQRRGGRRHLDWCMVWPIFHS